jgi:amidase
MPTTAGSVALAGSIPPDDAFIVQKLRQAGAIILGKGTLTEYANFIAIGMPTGYSSLGRLWIQPVRPARGPRTTLRSMTAVPCCRPEARAPGRASASMRT